MSTTTITSSLEDTAAKAERMERNFYLIAILGGVIQAGVALANKAAGSYMEGSKVQIWTFLFTVTFVGLFLVTGTLMLVVRRKLSRELGQTVPMRLLVPLAEHESRKAHIWRWIVGLTASTGLYFPSLGLPAGTSTLWANGCGFFAALFALLPLAFVNGRRPFKTRAKSALCALIGLSAAAFSLGWWYFGGFSSDWVNPLVWVLIGGSAVGGFLFAGVQPWVTRQERAAFDRLVPRTGKSDVDGWVGFFVSLKITNTFALLSMLTCFEGMTFTGGIPDLKAGAALWIVSLLILALVLTFAGSQLCIQWANGLGNPSRNGTGIMMSVPVGFIFDAALHALGSALGSAFTAAKGVGAVLVPAAATVNYQWTKERKPKPRKEVPAT